MVLLPEKREEMFHYLQALADPDYQQSVWVEGNYLPEVGHDSFGYVVTFFFQDTMLAEAPEKNVGTILESADEVPVIQHVVSALFNVLVQLGDNCPDEDYINCPDWQQVVNAANDAIHFYSD